MKLKTLSNKDNILKLQASEIGASFLNSIRRAAMFSVPVLAISDVYYTENSSAMYDEQLAHRLGLVPLTTPKGYNLPEECACKGKGCSRCKVKLSLRVVGPCTVYAKDLKSDDKKVEPVYPDTPLLILREKQEIQLVAEAQLGKGLDHIKWSPCHFFYQHYPSVKVKEQGKDAVEGARHCPRGVFEVKGDKVDVKNLEQCNLCLSCRDRSNNAIEVSPVENKYFITLESWGMLPAEEILAEACKIVKSAVSSLKI